MKISNLILAALLCISFTSTAAPSKEIKDLLPGRWDSIMEINGVRIEGISIYKTNGTVVQTIKITQGQEITNIRVAGTWAIDGDTIVMTTTESNAPGLVAIGYVSRDKVTFIDESQLSYVDEEGTATTEYRVP